MASGYDVRIYFTKSSAGTSAIRVKSIEGFISKPKVAPNYAHRNRAQFQITDPDGIPIALVPMMAFRPRADLTRACSVEVLSHLIRGTKVSVTDSDFNGRLFEVEMGPPPTEVTVSTRLDLKPPGSDSTVPIPDHPLFAPFRTGTMPDLSLFGDRMDTVEKMVTFCQDLQLTLRVVGAFWKAVHGFFEVFRLEARELIDLGLLAYQCGLSRLVQDCQTELWTRLAVDVPVEEVPAVLTYAFRPNRIMFEVVLNFCHRSPAGWLNLEGLNAQIQEELAAALVQPY